VAKGKFQKVRFTGKRTGLEQIPIPGVGIVAKGDTITIPAEQAKRWLAVTNADETSDWAESGSAFSADEAEATEQAGKEREKLAERAADEAPEEPLAEAAPAADSGSKEGSKS